MSDLLTTVDEINQSANRASCVLALVAEQFEGLEGREIADHIIHGVIYGAIHELEQISDKINNYHQSTKGVEELIDERDIFQFLDLLSDLSKDTKFLQLNDLINYDKSAIKLKLFEAWNNYKCWFEGDNLEEYNEVAKG